MTVTELTDPGIKPKNSDVHNQNAYHWCLIHKIVDANLSLPDLYSNGKVIVEKVLSIVKQDADVKEHCVLPLNLLFH